MLRATVAALAPSVVDHGRSLPELDIVQPSSAYWSMNAQESSPQPPWPHDVPQEFSIHTPVWSYFGAKTPWFPREVSPGDGTPTTGFVAFAASNSG